MNELDESRLVALAEALHSHASELIERVTTHLSTRSDQPKPRTTRRASTFTTRERSIIDHASLGLTNKEIAYALGISDSTVRVLMARAARRVGVRTRRELLARLATVTE